MKKILTMILLMLSFSGFLEASHDDHGLSPDEELFYAVKGCKKGLAVASTFLMNPLLTLGIAAYQAPEGNNDLKNIEKALDKGANINTQDDLYSWTPLMYAAYEGYPLIAQYLIDKGARKDIIDTKSRWRNYTALGIAEYYLNQYQTLREKCQSDMITYYDEKIQTYKTLVEILK